MSAYVYKIRKLFNGYASVRDYIVAVADDLGDDLRIEFNDAYMIIKHDELHSRAEHIIDKNYQSKWGNKRYKLVDYKWCPSGRIKK